MSKTWFVETNEGKVSGLTYPQARELYSSELLKACVLHMATPEIGAELHKKAMAAHDVAEHKETECSPRNKSWFVKIDDTARIVGSDLQSA